MRQVKTIQEVVDEMRGGMSNSPQFVRDWRTLIPADSHWHPGDPGDPNCKTCEGTGYLRIEGLPVSHKYYGKLVFCDCVDLSKLKSNQLDEEYGAVEAVPSNFPRSYANSRR